MASEPDLKAASAAGSYSGKVRNEGPKRIRLTIQSCSAELIRERPTDKPASLAPDSPRICLNSLRTVKMPAVETTPARRQSCQVGKCRAEPVGSGSSEKASARPPCSMQHGQGQVLRREVLSDHSWDAGSADRRKGDRDGTAGQEVAQRVVTAAET